MTAFLSIILAISVPLVLFLGLMERVASNKGIGWQFIRYNVICISVPMVAILALNGALTGEAATLIAGTLGYAFGKPDARELITQQKTKDKKNA